MSTRFPFLEISLPNKGEGENSSINGFVLTKFAFTFFGVVSRGRSNGLKKGFASTPVRELKLGRLGLEMIVAS